MNLSKTNALGDPGSKDYRVLKKSGALGVVVGAKAMSLIDAERGRSDALSDAKLVLDHFKKFGYDALDFPGHIKEAKELGADPQEIAELEKEYTIQAPKSALMRAQGALDYFKKFGYDTLDFPGHIKEAKELGADPQEIAELEKEYTIQAPKSALMRAQGALDYFKKFGYDTLDFPGHIKEAKELGADPQEIAELEKEYTIQAPKSALMRAQGALDYFIERGEDVLDFLGSIKEAKKLGADPQEIARLKKEYTIQASKGAI